MQCTMSEYTSRLLHFSHFPNYRKWFWSLLLVVSVSEVFSNDIVIFVLECHQELIAQSDYFDLMGMNANMVRTASSAYQHSVRFLFQNLSLNE